VLIVSLGSTTGLRADVEELRGAMQRAGVAVEVASARPPRERRTFALTDLAWARAARAAAEAGIAEHEPRVLLYHTVTSALLWPQPGAIRFDAPAAANRPGRHGIWQRPVERRRLAAAPLLVPVDPATLFETPLPHADAIVVPIPVEPSDPAHGTTPPSTNGGGSKPLHRGPGSGGRDISAITYAANPDKKGLDYVLLAWSRAHREGEELVVAGADLTIDAPGVRVVGRLAPAQYRALLRRARVFICAPRREDYGIAQLEALADGCVLVTTSAPGPYAALPLARTLDERLVVKHPGALGAALRIALDIPSPGYAERAAEALAPFRRSAVDVVVREQLLPRLLP
jgi:hypothetical protein